ncbi:hypothetical protein C882_3631 [Caenispirillum salinarum AK4]|uniref:Iron siderophore sensor protein n=1 Tax=Caenispirillum salinarum AK4 TaxID=1238182 RepID=K9H468_9PROT|nr:FecR family protein [Caenispirillum salinarum]EKV31879.1 hypothetical protein C882_3631 [Caenispirillum salinarum AK4]
MIEGETQGRDIHEEAAAWVVRAERGPLSEAETRALEAWLAESDRHGAAYAFAQATWNDLGRLGGSSSDAAVPADGGGDAVVPFKARPRRVARRRLWQGLAASVLMVAAIGGFNRFAGPAADYQTAVGEVRSVSLPDGSTVHLNTDSAIAVRYDPGHRHVALLRGEAVFAVAPASGAPRPFTVEAGETRARALGTRFLVRAYEEDTVEVAVLEHRVEVTAEGGGQGASAVVVDAGQAVRHGEGTGIGPVRRIDGARAAEWRHGRLVFDQLSLARAVAELNRYRPERIVVLDAALAERRVSGVFRLNGLDDAVDVIADELDARTLRLPSMITVLY